jgi:hypothetical protein
MAKVKITITCTREFELPPAEYYPEGATTEEKLRMEIQSADELPHEFMSGDDAEWTTTGEIVEEDDQSELHIHRF